MKFFGVKLHQMRSKVGFMFECIPTVRAAVPDYFDMNTVQMVYQVILRAEPLGALGAGDLLHLPVNCFDQVLLWSET